MQEEMFLRRYARVCICVRVCVRDEREGVSVHLEPCDMNVCVGSVRVFTADDQSSLLLQRREVVGMVEGGARA